MAEQSKRYDAHGVARQFVVVVGAVTLLLLVACSNDKASDSGTVSYTHLTLPTSDLV